MSNARLLAASISTDRISIATFDMTFPAYCLAEIMSNKELSVTVKGGFILHMAVTTSALVTSTNWHRFIARYTNSSVFALAMLARTVDAQLKDARPALRELGAWHLPYIDKDAVEDAVILALDVGGLSPVQLDMAATFICVKASVYRCHNVSPMKHVSLRDQIAGFELLLSDGGSFLSTAFEHQAQPDELVDGEWNAEHAHRNYTGWMSFSAGFVMPPFPDFADKQEAALNG